MQLTDQGNEIGIVRYFQEKEDWEGCSHRSGFNTASVEAEPLKWVNPFTEMIHDLLFLPAGRILRNSGLPKGSLLNCFVNPIGDSIEEIGEFLKTSLILWSEGGGEGTSLSSLRPEGDRIVGKGGFSSGPVSFLHAADAAGCTIESGGSRRAAGLALMICSHPDIFKFMDAKTIAKVLSCFNLSVGVVDNFIDSVESNGQWDLSFNNKVYDTIEARTLWDKLIHNMLETAEPGLLNLTNLMRNNSWYFAQIIATNPCGEVPLEAFGACCLGSYVLPNFLTPAGQTNWKKLEQTIYTAVRFLDNILSVNKYALPQIKIAAQNSRRVGCGVLGLAEYLFAKGERYGSTRSLQIIEKLMKFIRDTSYQASMEIAIEKGAFPKFDPVLYGKADFVRTLPASLRMDIKKHGIRNCTLMAMPPTGTTSLLADCTSGIEPLFAKAYKRKDRISERVYIHKDYEKYIDEEGETPSWYVDTEDLETKDHLEVQSIVQKYTDGSVSKTINVPKDTTTDELSELLLEYIRDLKGVTVYRDGSREGQVLNHMSEDDVKEYLGKDSIVDNEANLDHVKCVSGRCEI